MAKAKIKKKISPEDAFENLSLLDELDLGDPFRIGIVKGIKLVDSEEEYPKLQWITSQNIDDLIRIAALSYEAILSYFQGLVKNDDTDWNSPKVKNGLEAIMEIVGGSAEKLHRLVPRGKSEKLSLVEYEALEAYYQSMIVPKLEGKGDIEKDWEEGWLQNSHSLMLDTENLGAQDFDTIAKDRLYELFYIKDSGGKPFFDPSVIRKIKVFREVDGSFDISPEEDPFLRMQMMIDKDLNGAAMQILSICTKEIEQFYRARIRKKEPECIRLISYGVMALMLAGNSRNLMEHKPVKSSFSYFSDFLFFFEKALKNPEYMKWIAYPETQKEQKVTLFLRLAHQIAYAFFTRKDAMHQEMSGFIHRLIRKGEEGKAREKKGSAIVNFMQERDSIDAFLSHFPNGPIIKIIDLQREQEQEEALFFSPIKQGNFPTSLYTMKSGKKEISILRIPSPTFQTTVQTANIISSFQAFLFQVKRKKERLLMVHLQEKNSWHEEARCRIVENFSKEVEFAEHFFLLTLPKETNFYHQIKEFAEMDEADDFLEKFQEEVHIPENHGFTYPKAEKESTRFLERIFPEIHNLFFDGKKNLTRAERLDFIEITYLFLTLESIGDCDAEMVCFTSKDSIDKGPIEAMMLRFFCQLLEGNKPTESDYEQFRWMIYAPALRLRERATDQRNLYRAFSALSRIEQRKKDYKNWQKLFSKRYSI